MIYFFVSLQNNCMSVLGERGREGGEREGEREEEREGERGGGRGRGGRGRGERERDTQRDGEGGMETDRQGNMHMFSIIIPFIKTRVLFNLSFSVCVCFSVLAVFAFSASMLHKRLLCTQNRIVGVSSLSSCSVT